MSGADSPQGPDWWQASDGKWYPPEQRPGRAPQAPIPPVGPSAFPGPGAPGENRQLLSSESTEGPFFGRLLDMSFSRFVTPSIIKLLFVLAIIVASIFSLIFLIAGLANIGDGGWLLVILSPLFWLLNVIYARVLLELVIVFFRIEGNTRTRP